MGKKLFLKHGFVQVDQAPPGFGLMVKSFGGSKLPAFPTDWANRARQFGSGLTVLYSGQCPYHPDAVRVVLEAAQARSIEAKAIELKTAEEVRACSPSPYGVFGVVYNGELVSYRYFTEKEIDQWLNDHVR